MANENRGTFKKMSPRKLKSTLKRMFGNAVHDAKGRFVLVHTDSPTPEVRAARLDSFDAALFFDEGCPHCQPFIDDGALMVYTEDDLVGIRLLNSGQVETVMLRQPPLDLVRRGSANAALDDLRPVLVN